MAYNDTEVEEIEAELYRRALDGDKLAQVFLWKAGRWPID